MPLPRHLGGLIGATAITSLSVHLMVHRRQATADRAQLSARISILESLVGRLESDEHIPTAEIERLRKLSQPGGGEDTHQPSVSWKEVMLGRKKTELSHLDEADVIQEWNAAIAAEESQRTPIPAWQIRREPSSVVAPPQAPPLTSRPSKPVVYL